MLENELPIFLFVLVAALAFAGTLVAVHLIGPKRDNPVKRMPYESGMDPIKDARQRFDIRFYLLAIAFLVFDVELLFLYPWAVASGTVRHAQLGSAGEVSHTTAAAPLDPAIMQTYSRNRPLILAEVLVFLVLLLAAYIYAWRKGVFQWR